LGFARRATTRTKPISRKLTSAPPRPSALEEDCRRAAVVISARTPPADCEALAIDRKAWERHGALALRRVGQGWEIQAARPDGYARPWARSTGLANNSLRRTRPALAQPPDATPTAEDLEPGN
jgi:competence protein ComEC